MPNPTENRFARLISLEGADTIKVTMYGIVLLFLSWSLFDAVAGHSTSAGPVSVGGMIMAVIAYAVTLVLHELVHGAAFKIFGGHPTYGAGITGMLPYFYATSPGAHYSLIQMIVIGLAPFVVISLLALAGAIIIPGMAPIFAVAFIGNFSGAVGDLWLMSKLMAFARYQEVTVVDCKDGVAVYTPDPRAPRLETGAPASRSSFTTYWLWGAGGFLALNLLMTLIGPLFVKALTVGPDWFPLVQYDVTAGHYTFTLNILAPLAIGFGFATVATVLSRSVRRPSAGA